jgi:hypothetical protein
MKRKLSLIAVLASLTMGLASHAGATGAPAVARDLAANPAPAVVQPVHDGSRWAGRWDQQPAQWRYNERNPARDWDRRDYRERPHYRPRDEYYERWEREPRYYRPRVNRAGEAHVRWCLNRYRSYDVRTDTFQPHRGPRRYCVSPYI